MDVKNLARLLVLACMAVPVVLQAQQPRQLSEAELARIQGSVQKSKANAALQAEQQRQRAELERQQEALRRQQEALAYDDDDYYEEDALEPLVDTASAIFGGFMTGMNDAMARQRQADAAQQRFLSNLQREAEAVDRQRQREQERQRLAAERARLEQQAQQMRQQAAAQQQRQAATAGGTGSPGAAAASNVGGGNALTAQQQAAKARDEALRANVAAERQRLQQAREQQQAAQAEAEQKRLAQEKAEAERKQAEEQRRLAAQQALRQTEQSLRTTFRGAAITCLGLGKDVLYLKSSMPPKTGCNVSFEARCPGTPSGAGVRFSQNNYIGASCGMGDSIRIGQMGCPAEQVRIDMTSASCG